MFFSALSMPPRTRWVPSCGVFVMPTCAYLGIEMILDDEREIDVECVTSDFFLWVDVDRKGAWRIGKLSKAPSSDMFTK